jgi:hypothetical protein
LIEKSSRKIFPRKEFFYEAIESVATVAAKSEIHKGRNRWSVEKFNAAKNR